jgi:hypothetical protein
MVKSALEANGIPAVVFSDARGKQEVSLQFVRGAKLWSIQKTRFAQSTSSNYPLNARMGSVASAVAFAPFCGPNRPNE